MNINVSGKNIDVGNAFRTHAIDEITSLIDKYIGTDVDTMVSVEKEQKLFNVEICLHITHGFIIRTDGVSNDPYKAVADAISRLEARIRRHKSRLKDQKRRKHWISESINATGYVIRREGNPQGDEEHLIIAEQERLILDMSVSEAVMKMDLTGLPVTMFKNSDNGRINVVYKRPDGHVGWIDYTDLPG
ncbi:MAG: ribosome-associated translation inhibitor RaiA [Holosporales bacterium]|jgi:ribosomal subunit interface protein|nr:ribosome-associated translation inhibitor RaiA [Holosporales bacterium]